MAITEMHSDLSTTSSKPTGAVPLATAQQMLEDIEELFADEGNEDLVEALAQQYLEATGLAHDAIDRYSYLIERRSLRQKNREAEAKHQRVIADGLSQLAKQDNNLVQRLKRKLLDFMDARGVQKVETDRFVVRTQGNGGDAPLIIDEGYSMATIIEQYPECLTFEIDPKKVREILKAGRDLPFAALGERGRGLRIKPGV